MFPSLGTDRGRLIVEVRYAERVIKSGSEVLRQKMVRMPIVDWVCCLFIGNFSPVIYD